MLDRNYFLMQIVRILANYAIKDGGLKEVLNIAKALSDSNRLKVTTVLMFQDELCACQITEMLKLAPATVSRHMGVLQNAGLVQSRKKGRWVYYRISDSFPNLIRQWLLEYVQAPPDELSTQLGEIHAAVCRKDSLGIDLK